MSQLKDSHLKPQTQQILSRSPLQAFHSLGNSAGLKLLSSTEQSAQPVMVIQRIKLTINSDGEWVDDSGEVYSHIDIDLSRLCPGAVYDTDQGTVTLPSGETLTISASDQEDEDSDDPEYAEPERGYILSPGTLKGRRYRYLSGKSMRTTTLPRQQDWAKYYNPHHIIPNEVVRDNIQPDDPDPYNDAWNCIMLPTLSKVRARAAFPYKGKSGNKDTTKPLHANHPNYNYRVSRHITRSLKSSDDDTAKLNKAQSLATVIRAKIRMNTRTPQIKLDDMDF